MAGRNKDINRMLIQQAAITVFSQRGYERTSMDDIAEKCGMTKRTLYKHFASKKVLLLSIFEACLMQLHDSIVKRAAKNLSAEEHLKLSLQELLDFSMENYEFMRIFWMLESRDLDVDESPELLQRIKVWNESITQQGVAFISKVGLTGFFSHFSSDEVMELLSAINKGMAIQLRKDTVLNRKEIKKERLMEMVSGILELALKHDMPTPKR